MRSACGCLLDVSKPVQGTGGYRRRTGVKVELDFPDRTTSCLSSLLFYQKRKTVNNYLEVNLDYRKEISVSG